VYSLRVCPIDRTLANRTSTTGRHSNRSTMFGGTKRICLNGVTNSGTENCSKGMKGCNYEASSTTNIYVISVLCRNSHFNPSTSRQFLSLCSFLCLRKGQCLLKEYHIDRKQLTSFICNFNTAVTDVNYILDKDK
jgi:hypothetical protein